MTVVAVMLCAAGHWWEWARWLPVVRRLWALVGTSCCVNGGFCTLCRIAHCCISPLLLHCLRLCVCLQGEEATLAETAAETAAASSPAAGAAPASAECSAAQASGMAKASSASSAAGAATAAAAGAPDTAAVAAVAGEQQEQRQAGAGEGGKAGGGVAAEKRTRCKCGAAKCRGWLKI